MVVHYGPGRIESQRSGGASNTEVRFESRCARGPLPEELHKPVDAEPPGSGQLAHQGERSPELEYRCERFEEKLIVSDLASRDAFCRFVESAAGALIGLRFVRLTRIAEKAAMGAAPKRCFVCPCSAAAFRMRIVEAHPCRKG